MSGDIFHELPIGCLRARNRLVRAATYERLASTDHMVTDELTELYLRLGAGGAGSVITSFCCVRPEGHGYSRMLGAYDDSQVAGLGRLAEAIHEGGALAFLQLVCCGSGGNPTDDGAPAPGPSTMANPSTGIPMVEMNEGELRRMRDDFAAAARRAGEAGFDGVEIHAAHGYLLSQFLSPELNVRGDAYGRGPLGRARIVCEVADAVRGRMGEGRPVLVKINASDGRPGGPAEDESIESACAIAGHVDGIEVSGHGWRRARIAGPRGVHGLFAPYATRLAPLVDVPVILTGANRDVGEMCELVEGGISGFGIARPLVCEPDLPNRWRRDPAYVPRCVSCSRCFSVDGHPCVLDAPSRPREEA